MSSETNSTPSLRKFTFGPKEKMGLDRDVEKAFKEGRRVAGDFLTLIVLKRDGAANPLCRLGLRVPRKLGNAPTRNRAKRMLREIFRHEKANLEPGTDVVILIRPQIPGGRKLDLDWMRTEFIMLSKKSGIWKGEG